MFSLKIIVPFSLLYFLASINYYEKIKQEKIYFNCCSFERATATSSISFAPGQRIKICMRQFLFRQFPGDKINYNKSCCSITLKRYSLFIFQTFSA